jgi:alpha-galactosidase
MATSLRSVGLCHQLRFGCLVAGLALSEELGLSIPESYAFTWIDEAIATEVAISHAAMERLSIRAAGMNHVTWMLDIRDRQGGESLLERAMDNLLHKVAQRHPNFEPLTRQLAAVTGYIPVSGDTHLCEYLPYTARQAGWGRYAVQAYDHDWSERGRHARRAEIALLAAGHGDLAPLRTLPTERVEHMIAGTWHDSGSREEAVNVMNRSAPGGPKAISNLPDDTIVEVPGTLHRDGVRAEPIGALPEPIAEWCRRESAVAQLAVRATLEKRRDLARQALLLGPTPPDLTQVEPLLDAYLDAFEDQVRGRWE